jgi:hypothetical protein
MFCTNFGAAEIVQSTHFSTSKYMARNKWYEIDRHGNILNKLIFRDPIVQIAEKVKLLEVIAKRSIFSTLIKTAFKIHLKQSQ